MKKTLLTKLMLLLCALVVGSSSVWATDVTYTISGKNTLTTTGTAPTGSSATMAETYTTSKQMTGGESQTLTLTGYNGCTITEIKLSMHSNKSSGRGLLKYSVNAGTNYTTLISDNTFSDDSWYGDWSQSYVNVTKSGLNIVCGESNVIFMIETSANSLYCESYTITYTPAAPAYTITAQSNNTEYGTVSWSGSVITGSPNSGCRYADPAYTVSSGTATVSQSGNEFTVTPTSDCTVQINFEAIPTYTVTLGDDSSTLTEASGGAGVTLPTRSTLNGYDFVGWSETNVSAETTTAPTIIPAGAYAPTADITLYPVYSKTIGGGGTTNKTADVTISDYATANSWSNSQRYTSITMDENITATGKDNGNNSKYYSSSPGTWRHYGGDSGEITITTTNGTLKDVTISYTGNKITFGGADVTSGTAIDVSGTSAVFSVSGSSGNSQVSAISVSYSITGAGTTYYWSAPVAAAVETPAIVVAENPFLFSTTATITCATDGATIKYSYDNSTWNDYTAALDITETTTIYAKAIKDENESSVASVTATKNLAVPTVTVSGDLTVDLDGGTNVSAGTLSAAVTYSDAAVAGATVTWSSSNTDVATIDAATGAVTIKATGSVTFTATYAGNSDYAEATSTKVITVTDSKAPGTENNPYNVADAIAYINTLGSSTSSSDVYVSGIISQVDNYNDSYHSITYWISDDGTTTTQMEVYSGKGLSGANFSAVSDLKVGDIVTVKGKVKKYSDTPEFTQNNQLVSLVRNINLNAACTDGTKYYATYSNNMAFVVPADLTVSAISVSDGKLAVTDYATGDVVKANTGVLLSSTASGNHAVTFSAETGTEIDGNMLKASSVEMTAANTLFYRLTMHNGTTIGFWWGAADGAAFALDANKAYLAVPTTTEAPSFLWFDLAGETTDISATLNDNVKMINDKVYDLQGRRVANPTKGLYIVNGRKVVVK